MQHSDFTTCLRNLNIHVRNTQLHKDKYLYTKTKNCLLGCVHQHTNHMQPTLYWTAQTYFAPTLSWYRNSLFFFLCCYSKFNEMPSSFRDIELQARKKIIFVVTQWTLNYSLCLALHDTISKYPQIKLWYCFVSLFNQKTHELHLCILLKTYSIKLQTWKLSSSNTQLNLHLKII